MRLRGRDAIRFDVVREATLPVEIHRNVETEVKFSDKKQNDVNLDIRDKADDIASDQEPNEQELTDKTIELDQIDSSRFNEHYLHSTNGYDVPSLVPSPLETR